ncbi:ABC-F family ATP-binding cassette domain-containing protein [Balneolaceae bacterium ANBcel3]|nr:ABC-F family ATP-binding cassette domain-containing protein [Balneolaceae bacterium ANBcel3]
MTFLSAEHISKSFGLKPLFENITFGISKGDKAALVAPNGTGKSTLLNVLAGLIPPDSGMVTVQNGIRIGILEQEPKLDDHLSIRECITRGQSDTVTAIQRYHKAVEAQAAEYNEQTQKEFEAALAAMDACNAWDYEQRMQQILGKLNIHNLDQPVASLSGGEKKRTALAFTLLENPDILLLDEPTNHLDLDMIEWLEKYLEKSTITLLMVTHDRYFLDCICSRILEIDNGKLYHHAGNYSYYLQKKAERQEIEQVELGKAGQLLKKELEWMRRSPKARTTKSRSRIDAFYETAEKARPRDSGPELKLEMNMQRMGNKILELNSLSKRFDNTVILDSFSYSFSKGERIGIIGKNGSGKSTFLKLLTEEIPADSGSIDKGQTIVYGHYRQQGLDLDDSMRVIDVIKEVAEVVTLTNGKQVSASRFLEHFMFPSSMQYTPVGKLSGGERRRLGLMMVLIQSPNFLILDEPTNDLDLETLQRLEEFLMEFGGCLMVVSHDRVFMDKLVQHYFIFEGDGVIRDFNGTYLEYRAMTEQQNAMEAEKKAAAAKTQKPSENSTRKVPSDKKITYAERKEFNRIEKELEELEREKVILEKELSSGALSHEELLEKSEQYGALDKVIDEKSARWLELGERME